MTGVPCFTCGVTLEPVRFFSEEGSAPPSGGAIFRSSGNYGSAVYDACHDEYLMILICDACLEGNSSSVLECFPCHAPRPPDARQRWNPGCDPYARMIEEEHEQDQ